MALSSDEYAELVLRAMVLTASADGVRHPAEDRVAVLAWWRLQSTALSQAEYDALAAEVLADGPDGWEKIATRRGEMTLAQREDLVRAVVRTAMADLELAESELRLFRRAGRAVDLDPTAVKVLVNEVWHEERETPGPGRRTRHR